MWLEKRRVFRSGKSYVVTLPQELFTIKKPPKEVILLCNDKFVLVLFSKVNDVDVEVLEEIRSLVYKLLKKKPVSP